MTDVRALLKAKTKERAPQIQHPYAAYNASGQLRCSLCATPIKFNNPAAWKTHLESKSHKQMVEREKSAAAKGKRKAEDGMDVDSDGGSKKRRVSPDADEPSQPPNGFPADFFSDPSKAPPAPGNESDDDEQSTSRPLAPGGGAIDSEFEAFERAIAAASAKRAPAPSQDIFARATVFAEPELVDAEALQANGFPPEMSTAEKPGAANPEGEAEEEETEAQKARRKEQEEKELIMDRIIEEERAQEEADDKVRTLKARLEAIKKQRELKKKAASDSSMKP